MECLEAADYTRKGIQYLMAEIDGHPVLGIRTAFGDGTYFDEAGNEYPVDAGMIGAVPAEFTDNLTDRSGTWMEGVRRVTFDVPFECRYDKDTGDIWIGLIRIATDPDDE